MIAVIGAPVDRNLEFDVHTNRQQVQWDPCQLHPLSMSSRDRQVPLPCHYYLLISKSSKHL